MVNICGFSAWWDEDSLALATPRQSINNLKLVNNIFKGVNIYNDVDEKFQVELPAYNAGGTIVNSNFHSTIFDSVIKEDYKDINKIIIYRWSRYSEAWAKLKEFVLSENSWNEPDLLVLNTITKDSVATSQVLKYKIEYYKWINNVSTLLEDETKYLEIEFQLQSNFISDEEECFPLYIDASMTLTRVLDTAIVQPLMSLFPIFIKNSMTNYDLGNFRATLMTSEVLENLRTGKGFKLALQQAMIEYKEKILNFLTNGKPKCIRTLQGEMFVVNIIGNVDVSWSYFGTGYNCTISFDWVEIAESESADAIEKVALTYGS